jgi:hypothetical protein
MEKLELIIPYIMTTVVLIILAVLINRLFTVHLKKRIVESGPLDENAIRFISVTQGSEGENLKWALLLAMGGLGLITIQFTPFTLDQPISYGIEILFLAAGFYIYYLIQKLKK